MCQDAYDVSPMKILFIYNGAENLGIESISSVLKANGHETDLLFDPAVFSGDQFINNRHLAKLLSVDDEIVEKAIAMNAGVIGFSCYTGNRSEEHTSELQS